MMPVTLIREAINANPFRPFVIHITDRRSYAIRQPESVSFGPQERSLVVWLDDGGASLVETVLITGVDLLEPGEAQE
jgi:hypothetical protein